MSSNKRYRKERRDMTMGMLMREIALAMSVSHAERAADAMFHYHLIWKEYDEECTMHESPAPDARCTNDAPADSEVK